MKIAFIGYGQVGGALADHLQRLGHEVTLAANDLNSEKLNKIQKKNAELKINEPKLAVEKSEVVFLATPFSAVEGALKNITNELRDKILIDCTNPIGPNLSHGLHSEVSGSEVIQKILPNTKIVKAFTIYGFENFENNSYPAYNVKPAMMFCGSDMVAKNKVASLISELGWEAVDVGGLEQALHLEHMTLLWVRMVRLNGNSSNLVWARLQR